MLDEIYVEDKGNEVIVSIEYIVGGREAETAYKFKGEMAEKFKKAVLIEGKTLEESCFEVFGMALDEPKMKTLCEKNNIKFEKTFWVL